MADKMQGKCLCGVVTVTAAKVSHVEACHCGMCRTWGGGPFMGVQCGDDTAIEGMDNITQFTSSDWATRGFCKSCGTHIFYQFNQFNTYVMPAGVFLVNKALSLLNKYLLIKNRVIMTLLTTLPNSPNSKCLKNTCQQINQREHHGK